MNCPELTREQYIATMATPMRPVGAADDSFGPFPVASVVDHLIEKLQLPTTREDIEIHHVYVNDQGRFCHILFNWGEKNVYLILITKPEEKAVHGYRLLDLNAEYGLCSEEEAGGLTQ